MRWRSAACSCSAASCLTCLAPAALSLLTVTSTDPGERNKAFSVYGAVAGAGGAVGLLLGGVLTQYLSWRWCLYVNLIFAAIAGVGAVLLLRRQPAPGRPRLDLPGTALVCGGMFCLVYGFSNAALHSWHTPSTWGFLVAAVVLLALFALWQVRAAQPLLPLRVVLDRNRGGAYLTMLIASAGLFGFFLFLTYYMQQNLGYSPVLSGVAFLPNIAMIMVGTQVSTVVLMPRTGPRPLVPAGMLIAGAGVALLTRVGVHSSYAAVILPPMLIIGAGLGLIFAPVFSTGTFGVAEHDAGIASATVNAGQQIGGSIGTALLNTIFASATAAYIAGHTSAATLVHGRPGPAVTGLAVVHGYTIAFWWSAAIFAAGGIIAAVLFRSGALTPQEPSQAAAAPLPQAGRTA